MLYAKKRCINWKSRIRNFNAARVDGDVIDKLVGKAHDSAVESLGGFLFEANIKLHERSFSKKYQVSKP